MIKATELRIGNWINLSPHDGIENFGKVLSIGWVDTEFDTEFEQIYCECAEGFEWAFRDNYRGIPLTAEVLEKCGFEKDGIEYSKSGIAVLNEYQLLRYHYTGGEEGFVVIMYVHQLQNLYFALTGTELDVNL